MTPDDFQDLPVFAIVHWGQIFQYSFLIDQPLRKFASENSKKTRTVPPDRFK